MLIEKINTCTSSINELASLQANAVSVNAFESSVNKLSKVTVMIAEFVSTVKEMNKHDFCKTTLTEEDLEKMRDAITSCATEVNNLSLDNTSVAAISTLFQSQKAMLTVMWKSASKKYVDPIRSYLVIIQTFALNKAEISNLSKLLHVESTAEPSAEVVSALVANAMKANEITSNFQMSQGVRAFLAKAKDGTATFADITDEVKQWIIEHNLGSRIKLTF